MSAFWGNRRVCVTGGAGFLGSHLVEELERRGASDIFVPRKAGYDLVTHEGVTLAETIARHTGFGGEILWDTTKPNGQPRRMLDVSRAKEYFGFEAKMPFDEGLRRTVEWWEAHGTARAHGAY